MFKCLYLFSFTSYGLITGLADFFSVQCAIGIFRAYWYLQSILNPCLKAALFSVEKPDFTDFLLFFLSTFIFFIKMSYPYPTYQSLLSWFLHSSSALASRMCNDRKKDISAYEIYGCDSLWIQWSTVTMLCCFRLILCTRKEHIINVILLITIVLSRLWHKNTL